MTAPRLEMRENTTGTGQNETVYISGNEVPIRVFSPSNRTNDPIVIKGNLSQPQEQTLISAIQKPAQIISSEF